MNERLFIITEEQLNNMIRYAFCRDHRSVIIQEEVFKSPLPEVKHTTRVLNQWLNKQKEIGSELANGNRRYTYQDVALEKANLLKKVIDLINGIE